MEFLINRQQIKYFQRINVDVYRSIINTESNKKYSINVILPRYKMIT